MDNWKRRSITMAFQMTVDILWYHAKHNKNLTNDISVVRAQWPAASRVWSQCLVHAKKPAVSQPLIPTSSAKVNTMTGANDVLIQSYYLSSYENILLSGENQFSPL